jgi:hypothetical protein
MVTDDELSDIAEDEEIDNGVSSEFGEKSDDEEDEPKERDEVKEVKRLAHKETSHVRLGKLLVLVSILATAALVSTGTYIVLKDQEDDDFTHSVSI